MKCISDTQLNFPDGHTENPYYGALKSHILSSEITLHFAGDTHWAAMMLQQINSRFSEIRATHLNELTKLALDIHHESKGKTDFIITDSIESNICKISDGKILSNCEKAYIGDAVAYAVFTEHLEASLSQEVHDPDSIYNYSTSLTTAFDNTISDIRASTVGGLSVSISLTDQLFWYQQKLAIHAGPSKLKIGPTPTTIPFGNAQNGSHAVNFLSSERDDDAQALAVHLHMGNIGILWGPGYHIRPLVIANCSHDSLVQTAELAFKVKITGMKIG